MKDHYRKEPYKAGKNSLALILPSSYCTELGISDQTLVEIRIEGEKITIKKLEVK